MAYKLNEVTIRTNNSEDSMNIISEIWRDVESGKLPILFDSEHSFQRGISPVSRYSNYSNDENGSFDFTIMGVTSDFFQNIEQKTSNGIYKNIL